MYNILMQWSIVPEKKEDEFQQEYVYKNIG
jgi:hypothetical protein